MTRSDFDISLCHQSSDITLGEISYLYHVHINVCRVDWKLFGSGVPGSGRATTWVKSFLKLKLYWKFLLLCTCTTEKLLKHCHNLFEPWLLKKWLGQNGGFKFYKGKYNCWSESGINKGITFLCLFYAFLSISSRRYVWYIWFKYFLSVSLSEGNQTPPVSVLRHSQMLQSEMTWCHYQDYMNSPRVRT